MDVISKNIKQLRKHFKLTQAQFALKIGNKLHNVGAWEEGRGKPSYENLQRIANIFSIPVNDLIETELNDDYFTVINDKPAIYYNMKSESARELIEFLQEEIKEKNKIISQLLKIMNKEPEK